MRIDVWIGIVTGSPQAADIATPLVGDEPRFLVDLPNQSVELCQVHVRVSDAENQVQAIPADRHTCTQQAVEGLGDESLLIEPLRSEYAVVLVVDVDAYEPGVLNQPVTAPSLEYPAGSDARQVAFNSLANLLVGGRAERDNLLLEFGSLTPLYQVNIAEWFLCEVVLEHGDPDLREFRGIRTDCLSFRIPIVIFVFFHVRIIF